MSANIVCRINDRVRIQDQNGNPVDDTFTVTRKKSKVVILRSDTTSEERRVHKTRIIENVSNGNSRPAVVEGKEDMTATKAEKKAKKMAEKAETKPKKEKAKGVKLDLAALRKEGEVFQKPVSFDVDGVKAVAYVVVASDGNTFRCLNTYNGFLSTKSQNGTEYPCKDAEKKKAQLQKKGYKKL